MGIRGFHGLLRDEPQTRAWVEYLYGLDEPDFEVRLPGADDLPAVLLDLAVPHEDIGALVRLLPARHREPRVWWLLERCAYALAARMGEPDASLAFPALAPGAGPLGRYFYVYVLLAVLPRVRAFHHARGVPEQVSRLTLADLGRHLARHRQAPGAGGFDASWLALHFRGALYQLGRLQFQRYRLGERTARAVVAAAVPCRPGDPVLAVHIPGYFGALSPAACDASFARAREFFPRHFPEERYRLAVCQSWLLDAQLAEYLPAETNIVRFQRRFQPAYRPGPEDESILGYVFGRPDSSVDELAALPGLTRLQRAVIAHVRAGRHWYVCAGWLRL